MLFSLLFILYDVKAVDKVTRFVFLDPFRAAIDEDTIFSDRLTLFIINLSENGNLEGLQTSLGLRLRFLRQLWVFNCLSS